MKHLRQAFDRELAALEHDVVHMGRLAGQLIRRSVEALRTRDVLAAEAVIRADDTIDALHLELEHRVVALLATQQPMAGDLREVASILAISIDLERLADHAEGVSRAARRLSTESPMPELEAMLVVMEAAVQEMLADVLEAFQHRDVALAEGLGAKEDRVDALRARVFHTLLSAMAADPRAVTRGLEYLLAAQHLERAADHITNVAERVIYMTTGEMREINR